MLSSLFKKHFQAFLDDYAQDGYTFAVSSSGIDISNLELKPESLLPVALPFTVVSGVLQHVSITIPFTRLGSKPVVISIRDVVLLLKAKTPETWSWSWPHMPPP